jgi:SAM-dependent methyltransferase
VRSLVHNVRRRARAAARHARRGLRDALGAEPDVRRRLGRTYLHGEGIEIGALAAKLPLAPDASARYVDRLTLEQMREHYPELAELPLVAPDIVDDSESLASIPDSSLDFVVASHLIEHCEDPIGALANQLRTLRVGGVLFLAVPDKRFTFDAPRELTTLGHVERDHAEGPAGSRRRHYEEWVALGGEDGAAAAEKVDELIRQRYAIHFHVWTPATFLDLIAHCRDRMGLQFELELFERAGPEFFVVLRKTA